MVQKAKGRKGHIAHTGSSFTVPPLTPPNRYTNKSRTNRFEETVTPLSEDTQWAHSTPAQTGGFCLGPSGRWLSKLTAMQHSALQANNSGHL